MLANPCSFADKDYPMQKMLLDLRLVARQFVKSPGFAVTAVLMLAFGIGATTAIFSIVDIPVRPRNVGFLRPPQEAVRDPGAS